MSTGSHTSEAGSVLIEALAALIIVSTAIIMALHGFAEATARLKRTEEQLAALTLARNLIAETTGSSVYVPAERDGVSETGLYWSVKVHRDHVGGSQFLAKPYALMVAVRRGDHSPLLAIETRDVALEGK
jgi:type II secretory pathway component PulJ